MSVCVGGGVCGGVCVWGGVCVGGCVCGGACARVFVPVCVRVCARESGTHTGDCHMSSGLPLIQYSDDLLRTSHKPFCDSLKGSEVSHTSLF